MNMVLNIKKKWRKPVAGLSIILVVMEDSPEGNKAAEFKEGDKDLASLNTPVRNAVMVPWRVPSEIPYTQIALFKLLKIIEYTDNHETFETA